MFVRVVLDTCTVRNHICGRAPQLDVGALLQHRGRVRLSLAASTFVELTRQFADGDVSFDDWNQFLPTLDSIMDERWPCLPNGKQLAWLAGTQVVDPIESVENESRYMRACWHHLCNVEPHEIGHCQVRYCVADGTLKGIRLDPQTLRTVMAGERQGWIDYIRKVQAVLTSQGLTTQDEDRVVELIRSRFGTDSSDPSGLAEKLDTALRMIARFVTRSLSTNSAYNPESKRNRGDAFDFNLLFYIPLPAIIVTGDVRFVRGLRETGALHTGQVLTIDEFNSQLSNDGLNSLVEDFQTPERQLRMQREASYFHWENRGRPLGEDLIDWYASEPIA